MKIHGQIDPDSGGHKGNRWCDVCDAYHGPLYPCKNYDQDTLAEIKAGTKKHYACMDDPKWVERQLQNGVPAIVLAGFNTLRSG